MIGNPTVSQLLASPVDPLIAFAFGTGVVTFFAPCAFPLLPGYVAYFLGTEDGGELPVKRRLLRAGVVGVVTSVGFFLVYAALAGTAIAIGTGPLGNIAVLELVVGALLVVLGIAMASGRFDVSGLHVRLPERRRGVLGYFLFGVVYAVAAAGCTGGAFLGIASLAITKPPSVALGTFVAYALGMSLLMIALTVLSALGRATLLKRVSRHSGTITRVAGVVLAVAGVVQIYWFLFVFDGLRMLG